MTVKIEDEEIFEYLASLQGFMLKGIRMLDDDGERAAIVYTGDDPETKELIRNERSWCMVDTQDGEGRKLIRVDVKSDMESVKKFNPDNGKWKFVGMFNEYTDVLGLTETDSTLRNENGDKRFKYLGPKGALAMSLIYSMTERPTKEELIVLIRKEAEEIINYCLDKQKDFEKLFPQIKIDFLKPGDL